MVTLTANLLLKTVYNPDGKKSTQTNTIFECCYFNFRYTWHNENSDFLDLDVLRDSHQWVWIAELKELSLGHQPFLLELGKRKTTPKLWVQSFTDRKKLTAAVKTSLSPAPSPTPTSFLYEDEVNSFKGT
jgi:hypothetical protein